MTIIIEKFGLAYFAIPKVASTSVKLFLYHAESDRQWSRHEWPEMISVHHYWSQVRGFPNEPEGNMIADIPRKYWKFAVIRDPVQRLLSAYSNRVEFHGDMTRGGWRNGFRHWRRGLLTAPDIDTFFQNYNAYREINPIVRHHTNPQSVFLGPSLENIDTIYKINEIDKLNNDLIERTGLKIPFPREQTGGKIYKFDDLEEKTKSILLDITEREYEYLKEYYTPPQM